MFTKTEFDKAYAEFADGYAQGAFWRVEAATVLSELQRCGGMSGRVLDFGCNTGRLCALIAGFRDVEEVVGADVNPTALSMANRNLAGVHKPVHLLRASPLGHIDLEYEMIDGPVALNVLGHTDHPEQVLYELWRVLRPSGTLVLSIPNKTHYRVRDLVTLGTGDPGDATIKHEWSKSELVAEVTRAGFDVVFATRYGRSVLGLPGLGARVLVTAKRPR